MHPILINFGPIAIRTYGVFLAIAFISGLFLLKKKTRSLKISDDLVDNLFLWILISALVGSRLLYVLSEWKFYRNHLIDVFRLWEGGFHFFGGLLGACAAVVFFASRHPDVPLLKFADAASSPLAFGLFIGKVGCFFAGCCYGKECSMPWAVTFTHPESLAIRGVALHPSQLYESATYLMLFAVCQLLYRVKSYDGELFWFFVFLMSFARFHLEFLRWDVKVLFGLTLAGAISILLAAVSLLIMCALSIRWKRRNIN